MVTSKQKSVIDGHTKKNKEYKYNTKYSHQIIREQGKKKKNNLQKISPKQLTKWQ